MSLEKPTGTVARVRNIYELVPALESGAVAAVAPISNKVQVKPAPLYKVMRDNYSLEYHILSGETNLKRLIERSPYLSRYSEIDIEAAVAEGKKILEDIKTIVAKINAASKQKYKIYMFNILPGNGDYDVHTDPISLTGVRICRTYVGPSTLYFKHKHGDALPINNGEQVVSVHTHEAWHSSPTLFPFQKRITAVADLRPE